MAQEPGIPAVAAQGHPLHHSSGVQPSPRHPPSTWPAQTPDAPHLREAPEEAQDEEAQVQEADEAHKEFEAQTRQELESFDFKRFFRSSCSLADLNLVGVLMLSLSLAELWLPWGYD